MKKESLAPQTFEDYIREHGAPHTIKSDSAKIITGDKWLSIVRRAFIWSIFSEPECQHQNLAERRIGHVKSLTIMII